MIRPTAGASATGHELSTSLTPQDIQDTVSSWAWLGADTTPLVSAQITARPAGFVSGIEFQPDYRPNWSYYYPQAIQTAQGLGANWVFMTPTWTFSNSNPLTFSPIPGQDPLWIDFSSHGQPGARHEFKRGHLPHRALHHGCEYLLEVCAARRELVEQLVHCIPSLRQ